MVNPCAAHEDESTAMKEDGAPSWSMRGLRKWLANAPETRDELLNLVQDSRRFLEPDTVDMLEGVLSLPAIQVREIMTPRPAIVGLHDDDELLEIMPVLIESAHSRFPVFSSQDRESVVGILLAKDLLQFLYSRGLHFDLKSHMRQAVFVPETARADQLLAQLRISQSHLAVVVDEYGHTAGIVTMEDLLEEIVGEIEDEFDDVDEQADWIQPVPDSDRTWIVEAQTPIETFNEYFGTDFVGESVETMGGLLLHELGRVNDLIGQEVQLDEWLFTIIHADARSIRTLRATRP
jgi:magnesium and cobalt transporter